MHASLPGFLHVAEVLRTQVFMITQQAHDWLSHLRGLEISMSECQIHAASSKTGANVSSWNF